MTCRILALVVPLTLALTSPACSDDEGKADDSGVVEAGSPRAEAGTPRAEAGTPSVEAGAPKEDAGAKDLQKLDTSMAWPDLPVYYDAAPWSCTPGAAGMCDDNKTLHCPAGTCTPCPAGRVDCDRKEDCECGGACDGSKCVQ